MNPMVVGANGEETKDEAEDEYPPEIDYLSAKTGAPKSGDHLNPKIDGKVIEERSTRDAYNGGQPHRAQRYTLTCTGTGW